MVYFSRDYSPHDQRFLAALAETSHRVSFLRLEARGPGREAFGLPHGIELIDWWGGRRPLSLVDLPRAQAEVRKVLRKTRPDLVHAGPVQRSAFLTAAVGFHPLVTMSWGSDILRDGRKGAGRAVATYTLRRSDVLVCDCRAVQEAAAEMGMEPDRTIVFPWGVDLRQFHPGKAQALRERLGWQDAFILLSARAWEPLYGVDVLVEAFLRAARPRPELRLLLLGHGSQAPLLLSKIARANMEDRVHLAGQLDPGGLPEYFRSADVYLSASHSDGSSVSLLEAMASGLPAIVSSIPGNREWVEPDVHGWLFPDGDVEALAQRIGAAYDRRLELEPFGARARQRAESRADWKANFPMLLHAYSLAVQAPR